MTTPECYHRGIRESLLLTLDLTAKSILEIGCDTDSTARLIKERFTDVDYIAIGSDQIRAAEAGSVLAQDHTAGTRNQSFAQKLPKSTRGKLFDLIILGDYLSYAFSPLRLLESLRLFSHNKSLIVLSAINS
jgi:hypothetical protein